MKKVFSLCLLLVISMTAFAKQADIFTVSGNLIEKNDAPVIYANVVLLKSADNTVAAGGVSDEKGAFSFSVPQGKYILSVSFMGYKTVKREIIVNGKTTLGAIKMEMDSAVLSDVTITAKMTERKGDRLVVNLASSPLVEGKSTKDILNYTPGVWMDNKGSVSINGNSNVRVMINDRDVKMTGEELMTYLESLQASDILKIEIIPMAGAEYEADSAGGVIHITLKKKALEGFNGTVGFNYKQNKYWGIAPWIKASFRKDRLSLNVQYNYNDNKWENQINEQTDYFSTKTHQDSYSWSKAQGKSHYTNVDAVYDLTKNSEIGFAIEYYNNHSNETTVNNTLQTSSSANTLVEGQVPNINNNQRINTTAYYKIKTDTLGSSLKLVADYTYKKGDDYTLSSAFYSEEGEVVKKNIYDYTNPSTINLYSLRADFDKKTQGKISWSAGVKYSNSHIASDALYRTYDGEDWSKEDPRSNSFSYNEQVLAGYGKMNITLPKGWSATAGLRAEYTTLESFSLTMEQKDSQSYMDFFPQVSLMKTFGEKGIHSLSANYTRRLSRPYYGIFNPYVVPISEFSSVVGNPDIRPSYTNRYSITGVLYGKYSISAEYNMKKGNICQVVLADHDNANKTIYKHLNIGDTYTWNLSFSAPITVSKWYGINMNGSVYYSEQTFDSNKVYSLSASGSIQNNFNFGKGWSADISGWGATVQKQGNLTVDPMWCINSSVVKKCMNNRLVFSLYVNDIFDSMKNIIYSSGAQFEKCTESLWSSQSITLGVRWNFAAGKNSKAKNVEKGNNEQLERL